MMDHHTVAADNLPHHRLGRLLTVKQVQQLGLDRVRAVVNNLIRNRDHALVTQAWVSVTSKHVIVVRRTCRVGKRGTCVSRAWLAAMLAGGALHRRLHHALLSIGIELAAGQKIELVCPAGRHDVLDGPAVDACAMRRLTLPRLVYRLTMSAVV